MSTAEADSADNNAAEFVLDPSDPLYMLLNNTHDPKQDPHFGLSFPTDLDFNDASFPVFVDPNALFIDGKDPVHSTLAAPIHPQDLLNSSFHFSSPTLSSASASADESFSGFNPSSPGSSSSTRASPPAHVVQRLTAGVVDFVLPWFRCAHTRLDAVSSFFNQNSAPFMPSFQSHPAVQQAMPPTPSPSPSPPVHAIQGPQTHVINTIATGRPKTSHTTIERRYRTNLNARIQSLKASVPALRVLDQNYKNDEYKVDGRGYVDGVKVARKGSKANVLGKAVEYIR